MTDLTREKQTLIADKLNLISNMNDQQKYFVLTKARDDQDTTIVDLIVNSGFNEQEYVTAQQSEPIEDLEDIFAIQLSQETTNNVEGTGYNGLDESDL